MRADDTRDLTPDELRVAAWTIRREGEMSFPFVVSARSMSDLEAELSVQRPRRPDFEASFSEVRLEP